MDDIAACREGPSGFFRQAASKLQNQILQLFCNFAAAAGSRGSFRKSATAPGSAENILTIIPCLPYNETQNQMDKRRQMMRVSKFSDMIPAVVTLAVFTGALALFPGKGLFVYPVPAYIVFALCEGMALLNVWALGKYYVPDRSGHRAQVPRHSLPHDAVGRDRRVCVAGTRSARRGRRQVLVLRGRAQRLLREGSLRRVKAVLSAVCARLDQGRPLCHPPDRCAQCRQDPAVCAGALWQAGL